MKKHITLSTCAILTGAVIMMANACTSTVTTDSHSGLKQLQEDYVDCDAHPERIPGLKERYSEFVTMESGDHEGFLWEHMSTIPEEYLQWMFLYHRMPLHMVGEGYQSSSRGLRGKTTVASKTAVDSNGRPLAPSGYNATRYRPKFMWVKQPFEARPDFQFYGLIHEIGHAIDHYLLQTMPTKAYEDDMDRQYDYAVKYGKERDRISYMARQRVEEYTPEWFDSWYCGESSRAIMKERYPVAYKLAQKYLIDHEKLDSGSTGDTPAGREHSVDKDADGVADFLDLCPSTPSDTKTSRLMNTYGCGPEEQPERKPMDWSQ